MAADDDRELHARQARHRPCPEAGAVHDDGRVDRLAAGGRDARHAVAAPVDRHDLDALLDRGAVAPRAVGERVRDRRRIAVARLRLVEDGTEPGGVDPRLHTEELGGLEELGPDAECALDGQRRLQGRAHRP